LGTDYLTLNDYLADPEVGITRSTYFRLVGAWRYLAVRRELPMSVLAELDVTKVDVVLAAIKAGRVELEEALEDVRSMGQKDLREVYGPKDEEKKRSPVNGTDDEPEDADVVDEPLSPDTAPVDSDYRRVLNEALEAAEAALRVSMRLGEGRQQVRAALAGLIAAVKGEAVDGS
jgi:hypothetical protein